MGSYHNIHARIKYVLWNDLNLMDENLEAVKKKKIILNSTHEMVDMDK